MWSTCSHTLNFGPFLGSDHSSRHSHSWEVLGLGRSCLFIRWACTNFIKNNYFNAFSWIKWYGSVLGAPCLSTCLCGREPTPGRAKSKKQLMFCWPSMLSLQSTTRGSSKSFWKLMCFHVSIQSSMFNTNTVQRPSSETHDDRVYKIIVLLSLFLPRLFLLPDEEIK